MKNVYQVRYQGFSLTYMTLAKNFEQALKKALKFAEKLRKRNKLSKNPALLTVSCDGDLDF